MTVRSLLAEPNPQGLGREATLLHAVMAKHPGKEEWRITATWPEEFAAAITRRIVQKRADSTADPARGLSSLPGVLGLLFVMFECGIEATHHFGSSFKSAWAFESSIFFTP